MPKVMFLPQNLILEFESGQLPYHQHGRPESLLDVALNFGIPLEHACGGNCACTTCHVIVRERDERLSPMQECEEDRLYEAPGLTLHSRLGCQAVVQGDVIVDIPNWNRNYVSEGGSSINLGGSIVSAQLKPPVALGGLDQGEEDFLRRSGARVDQRPRRDPAGICGQRSPHICAYSG